MNKFQLSYSVFFVCSYFDSDDLDDDPSHRNSKTANKKKIDDDLDYQPAPGSPSYQANKKDEDDDDDEEEDDPLEQFMKANNNQAKKDLEMMGKKKAKKEEK